MGGNPPDGVVEYHYPVRIGQDRGIKKGAGGVPAPVEGTRRESDRGSDRLALDLDGPWDGAGGDGGPDVGAFALVPPEDEG